MLFGFLINGSIDIHSLFLFIVNNLNSLFFLLIIRDYLYLTSNNFVFWFSLFPIFFFQLFLHFIIYFIFLLNIFLIIVLSFGFKFTFDDFLSLGLMFFIFYTFWLRFLRDFLMFFADSFGFVWVLFGLIWLLVLFLLVLDD